MRRKKLPERKFLIRHIRKNSGFVTVLLILVLVALGVLLSGALFDPKFTSDGGGSLSSNYYCCDSGDGEACKPIEDKKLTWKGTNATPQEYALIKSNIALLEGSGHLAESSDLTSTGEKVFMNTSDTTANYASQPGCENGKDLVFGTQGCAGIPNDEIIYVCKSNCEGRVGNGKFDAYFRMSDLPSPGVPDAIKQCYKPKGSYGKTGEPTIVVEKQPNRDNLQLQTFKVIQGQVSTPWLSPYCKPAIYLYPESTSFVNVRVNSSEPFTLTDPIYPEGGWSVIADSTGVINYSNKFYDYLYYETKVDDSKVSKPNQGFVIEKEKLSELLSTILPKLGLNQKETNQFKDYWLKTLPNSPYYFVGIVPQKDVEKASTLSILPNPKTEIRVTLYFEPLQKKTEVEQPIIKTPARSGFTVVEWGGIYKKDPGSNFSCLQ